MVVILRDSEINELLTIKDSISIISQLIVQNELISPPRSIVNIRGDSFAFTCGEDTKMATKGFRFYISQNETSNDDQITTVYKSDGSLKGIVIGKYLSILRTGAIGGVAINKMAKKNTRKLSIIGTGKQAQMQLRAALSVRSFTECRVFSKTLRNKNAFITKMSREFPELSFIPSHSIPEAVDDADVVVCATNSKKPLLFDSFLKREVHINSIGPKFINEHELDLDIFAKTDLITTDSLNQVNGYDKDFFLKNTSYLNKIIELSSLKNTEGTSIRSVFISTGLSGTEVALANVAIEKTIKRNSSNFKGGDCYVE